ICSETKKSYTYNQLYKKTNALSNFFYKYSKIKQSDVIVIVLPNVPEYPIIALGAIQAGLVVSTANSFYTADEIAKQLINCNPKIIFTLTNLYPTVCKAIAIAKQNIPVVIVKTKEDELIPSETIDFESIVQGETKLDFCLKRNWDDTILLLYSSGTTGLPKGVELTHKNIVSNLKQMSSPKINNLTETNALPLYHCYGLTVSLLNGLRHGSKLITMSKFRSQLLLNVLNEHRPTLMHVVPPIFFFLLNSSNVQLQTLLNLKTLISGAAPLGGADITRFREKTNNKISVIQAYGLTETSPVTHIQTTSLKNGIKTGGIGFSIPSTETCIVSVENGIPLASNEIGELLIRGPQVMKGYYNNTAATNAVLRDGWFKTGDLGYYDTDEHFFITDRIKELIKVKGYQVPPAELEEILRDHPDIEDAAVVGIPHPKFGEVPKAFVVLKPNLRTKKDDIHDYVNKKVSEFKQLRGGLIFITEIPKSPSGKILRRVLKEM
ncbi:hypothetical protein FQR65_LT00649, partial [Abscondita terminalis]